MNLDNLTTEQVRAIQIADIRERLAASGNDWAEAVEEAGEQRRESAADIACHYEWVTVEVQP